MSIGFRKVDPSIIPNAPAGRVIFFTDLSGNPQYKDENGNIATFTGPDGPAGAQGPAGQNGAPGAAGQNGAPGQGFNPRGTYSNANSYAAMDFALFGGSSWLALVPIAAGVGIAPGSDPTKWQLIAQIGNQGQQGPSGVNSFPTYAAAVADEASIGQGTFVFVLADESIDGGASTYFWDGTNLNYVVVS